MQETSATAKHRRARAAGSRSVAARSAKALRVCQFCGRALGLAARGRPRTFCSDTCRHRAFRAKTLEPHLSVPHALLDELSALMQRLGRDELRSLSRALAAHDVLKARRLLKGLLPTPPKSGNDR